MGGDHYSECPLNTLSVRKLETPIWYVTWASVSRGPTLKGKVWAAGISLWMVNEVIAHEII